MARLPCLRSVPLVSQMPGTRCPLRVLQVLRTPCLLEPECQCHLPVRVPLPEPDSLAELLARPELRQVRNHLPVRRSSPPSRL